MKLYLTILLFTLSAILDATNAQICTAGQQPKLDYTYIGCYKDVCCGEASEYQQNYLNFIDNTIESCMAIARSKNLPYAALSFGNNCKGGSTYGRFGLADPAACNKPCKANPSQICGGIPDQSVYELYYPVVNETRPCVTCEKGTYSEDGTKCVPAPKGAYVPTNGSSTYINCTRGTYQNQFGQTSCITCDVRKGQLCPNDVMIDPIMVPAGYIANSTLSTITTPCPIATFRASNADATKCEPCFAGTYNDKTGQGACVQAPPGTFTSAGASRSIPCPVGTSTLGLSGQSMCRDCIAGTVSNRTGSYYCTPCELSTQYQDQPGQVQCNTCGPYTFSYKPTEPCQKCGVCKSMYTYLASQSLLGNLKLTENGNDWNVLKDASSVGIDVSYGKAGVLLQLKKCYNVGQFAIEDLKNPNAQCIAAGAPDQVPDINTPPPTTKAPGTPPPVPVPGSNGGIRHTCSFTLFMGVVIVTLMSLAA